jgi:hypothetical protein
MASVCFDEEHGLLDIEANVRPSRIHLTGVTSDVRFELPPADQVWAVVRLQATNTFDDVRPHVLHRSPTQSFGAVGGDVFCRGVQGGRHGTARRLRPITRSIYATLGQYIRPVMSGSSKQKCTSGGAHPFIYKFPCSYKNAFPAPKSHNGGIAPEFYSKIFAH